MTFYIRIQIFKIFFFWDMGLGGGGGEEMGLE